MIKINVKPRELRIDIKGHADFAESGKDIVCAACSILYYTLAESLVKSEQMLKEPAHIHMESGEGTIFCNPKEEFRANIEMIFWTVLNGYELLAENYEKNVIFSIEGLESV